ncbi:AcvB/VirJ family lysyl-phosphatidylglycerol hydrolase [Thiobacillus sp.]
MNCVWMGFLLASNASGFAADTLVDSTLEFSRFGKLSLYAPPTEPGQVVLFISGDGGWNLGVVDMARELAGLDSLVVGIDIRHYLKSLETDQATCAYPAGDLEALGQFVQKKLGYRQFHRPVLVGYSSGATLAYAALVQAPAGTFSGAISLGFCPDLLLHKPMCKGNGLAYKTDPKLGQIFSPASRLDDPWVVLHGDQDLDCSPAAAARFVGNMKGASLITLPKAGHGFSVPRNWLPQFRDAFARIARPTSKAVSSPVQIPKETSVNELPLITVGATQPGDTLAILLTGDGGWAGLDKALSATLAARGIPVIGWDSLRYYWTPRTPDTAARDLARILTYYQTTPKQKKFILIGYSFGADVLPFLVRRLPGELKSRIEKVILLAPGTHAHFEFKLADWLGGADDGLDIRNEVAHLTDTPLLCLYGSGDRDSLCPGLGAGMGKSVALPGGHHFDGDYAGLARLITDFPSSTVLPAGN